MTANPSVLSDTASKISSWTKMSRNSPTIETTRNPPLTLADLSKSSQPSRLINNLHVLKLSRSFSCLPTGSKTFLRTGPPKITILKILLALGSRLYDKRRRPSCYLNCRISTGYKPAGLHSNFNLLEEFSGTGLPCLPYRVDPRRDQIFVSTTSSPSMPYDVKLLY